MDVQALGGHPLIQGLLLDFSNTVAGYAADGYPKSLGYYLEYWVAHSDVIESVGGDYSTYMLVVALAVAKFHEDPSYFGENAAAGITSIFEIADGGALPHALDPNQWKEWVFRRKCGQFPTT